MNRFGSLSRRSFLATVAGGAALGTVVQGKEDKNQEDNDDPSSGLGKRIEHVILVTMENRSLDHFLGWMAGIDGTQSGLTYLDAAGIRTRRIR